MSFINFSSYLLLICNPRQHYSKLAKEDYGRFVYYGNKKDTQITKDHLSPVLDNVTQIVMHYRQPPLKPLEEFTLENYIEYIPNYRMIQIGEDGYEPNQ